MSALFEHNIALLKEKGADDLAKKMTRHRPELKLVGKLEDASLNLQLPNGNSFYHPDILTAASEEVSNYADSPVRYFLPISLSAKRRADDLPEWEETGRFLSDQFVIKLGEKLGDSKKLQDPNEQGGYMVSFGVGLGIQLSLYLDNYPVRNLILIEPNLDLLYHSFHCMNWQGFFTRLEERGGSISFITEPNGTMAGAEAIHAMRGKDYSLVDGSYAIQHYNADYMDEALASFKAGISILQYGLGFLEDEIIMYENASRNLINQPWRSLPSGNPPGIQPVPAFIIGSGPSLDKSIETLKANREKAIFFSSGTAISALINNDIYPDFHAESENTPHTPEMLKKVGIEKLKNTILLATNSVPPEIVDWFKDVIFVTRDSVTPTRLFHTKDETINLAAANVTCLSSRSAMGFGFQTLICFGTDFGAQKPDQHHSKSSIYNTTDDPFYKRGFDMPKMTIEVPGQKRKKIYTNVLFQFARQFLEKLYTEANGFDIYNTADGARILGTKSLDLKQIKLTMPFKSKNDIVASILDRMPATPAGERYPVEIAKEFEDKIVARMDVIINHLKSVDNFPELYEVLQPRMQQGQGDTEHSMEAALRTMASGTFLQVLQHLDWLRKRMGQEEWADFWPIARELVLETTHGMKARLERMFRELRSDIQ